jgi:uncharacterized protein YecE (DUF72 family)
VAVRATAELRIGVSGWRYPPWRGVFYPEGLAQRRELEFISRQLNSVEINGSFYSLQRPQSYRAWYEQTPDDFVFAVKGGRFVTHMKRLRDVRTPLANFFASGVLALERKLGPLLWQLPPSLRFDRELLTSFFALLPRSTTEAARLAEEHDHRLDGRAWTTVDADRPLRHALEVRHPSFHDQGLAPLLREHDVALVTADTAGRWPLLHERTSDFAYLRLHGDQELYVSGYGPAALDEWAARIRAMAGDGLDVYAYFDNDVKVHAPFDAINLAARLDPARRPVEHPGLGQRDPRLFELDPQAPDRPWLRRSRRQEPAEPAAPRQDPAEPAARRRAPTERAVPRRAPAERAARRQEPAERSAPRREPAERGARRQAPVERGTR